jgi:hypothetical protein
LAKAAEESGFSAARIPPLLRRIEVAAGKAAVLDAAEIVRFAVSYY